MWPLVFKNISVVSIGGKGSGKTVGYLVPLINMLCSYDYPRPINQSPLAVILCPSWKDVVEIEGWVKTLAAGLTVPGEMDTDATKNRAEAGSKPSARRQYLLVPTSFLFAAYETKISPREVKVLAVYEKETEEKKTVALANGCHVLITTPPSLVRIVTCDNPVTNLDRCCHLMVEKADVTFERFGEDVNVLMRLFGIIEEKRRNGNPMQTVLTSRQWTDNVRSFAEEFLKSSDSDGAKRGTYFMFVDYLEAFVYGKQKVSEQVLSSVVTN